LKTIEERLDAIEARTALSELRSSYCWYTTRGLKAEVLELFTEDGVFENHRTTGGTPAVASGHAELAAYFERMAPGRRLPVVMNEVLRIDGDEAEGTCVMMSMGQEGFCGHYVDTFRRAGGRWRFSRRSFFPYWPDFAPNAERRDP
jgi:hypothetical protein